MSKEKKSKRKKKDKCTMSVNADALNAVVAAIAVVESPSLRIPTQ